MSLSLFSLFTIMEILLSAVIFVTGMFSGYDVLQFDASDLQAKNPPCNPSIDIGCP